MSLIKKIDVDKHFAARRAMRLGRTGPLSESGFRIERTPKAAIATATTKEVTPGYSSVSAPVTPVPLAADLDGTGAPTISRSRQA